MVNSVSIKKKLFSQVVVKIYVPTYFTISTPRLKGIVSRKHVSKYYTQELSTYKSTS